MLEVKHVMPFFNPTGATHPVRAIVVRVHGNIRPDAAMRHPLADDGKRKGI
jgi:hypothetical protein